MSRIAASTASQSLLLGALALSFVVFAPKATLAQTDSIRARLMIDPSVAAREIQLADRGQEAITVDQARVQIRSGGITASDSLHLQVLRHQSDPAEFQSFVSRLPAPAEPVPYTIAEELQVLPGSLGSDVGVAEGAFNDGSLVSPVYHWSQEWVVDAGGRAGVVAIRHQATLADHRSPDGGFEATLYAWAIAVADSTRPIDFDPPLRIQAVVEGGDATPDSMRIAHTRIPLTEIRISDPNPGDSIVVHLIPDHGTQRSATIRLRPTVVVTGPDTPLQGWGVEATSIALALVGATNDDPVTASLTSSSAIVSPSTVEVARNAPATATVRSKGSGTATYTVAWGNNRVTHPVDVQTPWRFLIFVGSGAILGALAARLRMGEKGSGRIVAAVLVGAFMPIGYFALGINLTWLPLPPTPVFSELSSAFVAFVAAGGITAMGGDSGDSGTAAGQPAPAGGG